MPRATPKTVSGCRNNAEEERVWVEVCLRVCRGGGGGVNELYTLLKNIVSIEILASTVKLH